MAKQRLSVRKIKEVLRLSFEEGRSQREIARSLRIGRSSVGEYLARARKAGLEWPLPEDWTDVRLEAELFPAPLPSGTPRPQPDWPMVHRELQEDRSLLELFSADYTFLNDRLATHYEIEGVYGDEFRRVQYPDDRRRGIFGHGSILQLTPVAARTSPVLRGKWVMEVLMGTPPPLT